VFLAKKVTTRHGTFGYIRLFTFNVLDAEAFVDEFVHLTEPISENGLIVDVRGNGGGLIHAAERLLQVLTPHWIQPERAQFINTPLNLAICRNHAPSDRYAGLNLRPWIESIAQAVETGATYSLGYPITPEKLCNNIGQRCYGPKVLITDALCYSATDIFAAGFQDHRIGKVLGVSENTGAGGANVWSHGLLCQLATPFGRETPSPSSEYRLLPQGTDLRVAIRRTVRVGAEAGSVIEDLGIVPDSPYKMTKRDVLEGNLDLIEEATKILSSVEMYGIKVNIIASPGELPKVDVQTQNVTRLDVLVNQRPMRSFDVVDDKTEVVLQELVAHEQSGKVELEFQGYKESELVVARRESLTLA
jgi:hypothetical protein